MHRSVISESAHRSPLQPGIHAGDLLLCHRVGDTNVSGEILQRLLPEGILAFMSNAKPKSDLIDRIVGADQRLNLHNRRTIFLYRTECDPPSKHMAFWRHKGKRLVI